MGEVAVFKVEVGVVGFEPEGLVDDEIALDGETFAEVGVAIEGGSWRSPWGNGQARDLQVDLVAFVHEMLNVFGVVVAHEVPFHELDVGDDHVGVAGFGGAALSEFDVLGDGGIFVEVGHQPPRQAVGSEWMPGGGCCRG